MGEPIAVLIAGSEGPFRAGLARILEAEPDIRVVGEAGGGREVADCVLEVSPQVVLLDVPAALPGELDALPGIAQRFPAARTVVLADWERDDDVSRALAHGAQGYLPRSSSSADILEAVRRAAAGEMVLSPHVAARIASRARGRAREPRLSDRETDVLRLLGDGLNNREIAGRLTVTVSTVRTYVYRLMEKLDLRSRSEITAYAARLYASYARIEHALPAPAASGAGPAPAEAALDAERAADRGIVVVGERKQATALALEIEWSGAEDILLECLHAAAAVVRDHGGEVAWYSGRGLTALFGVPAAREHAPQQALHTALAIRERLTELAEQPGARGRGVTARTGVNTGVVIVEQGADPRATRCIPVAGTAERAADLRDRAGAGEVLVAGSTHRLTRDQFRFEAAGDYRPGTGGGPVAFYRLLAARTLRSKLDGAAARGLTGFVGRQREIEILREAFEKARSGAGQVVGVGGGAGVGKSRLVLEMRRALPAGEYTYLEGGCVSYDGAVPYLPLLGILRSYFDIEEGEGESVVNDRIRAKLVQLNDRLTSMIPALQDVLSLEVEDQEYLKLEPPERRWKLFEAVKELLIRESRNRTLVIAIEDLHCVDSSTQEFLLQLADSLAAARIMLIGLYRLEYDDPWARKSYYSRIGVDELPPDASADLVRSILKDGDVSPELLEVVTSRAGGNPLFLEEFTRTLFEKGSIEKRGHTYVLAVEPSDIGVPDTLQGIIAARMDHLGEGARETMRVASVIGRDFSVPVLEVITGMGEELRSHLLELQAMELVYETSLFPEHEYMFKHALTQEVAYSSLTVSRRKELHERAGQAIEELYPERQEELYEALAHHYARSDNSEKACRYLTLSGDKATGKFSNSEAFYFYRQAINRLNTMAETAESRRRVLEVVLLIEGPMKLLAYPEGSLEILQDAERLALELGDKRALAIIYASMGLCHTFKGNSSQGMRYAEYCFDMAERIEDLELLAPTAFDLCSSYTILGEFTKTVQVAPKVLALLEKTGRESESFGVAFNFNVYSALSSYYGQAMGFLGDFEEGEALCQKGLLYAQRIDNLYSVGFAEMMYGLLLFVKGDGSRAVEHLHHALTCGEEGEVIPVIGMACGGMGWAYCLLLGDLAAARAHLERGLQVQRDAGLHMLLSLHNVALGMVHFEQGDPGSARSCIEDALDSARSNGEKWAEGMAWIFLGRVLGQAREPEYERAEECILHGIRHSDETGMKPTCALGHLNMGELYARTGQMERAIKCLKQAEGMFSDMGMDCWLSRTQAVLQEIGASDS